MDMQLSSMLTEKWELIFRNCLLFEKTVNFVTYLDIGWFNINFREIVIFEIEIHDFKFGDIKQYKFWLIKKSENG